MSLEAGCDGSLGEEEPGPSGISWGVRQAVVMKRQRSWEDGELLTSNTEDNTDQSEQDESSPLRSPWSLVSQGTEVHESVRPERWLPS